MAYLSVVYSPGVYTSTDVSSLFLSYDGVVIDAGTSLNLTGDLIVPAGKTLINQADITGRGTIENLSSTTFTNEASATINGEIILRNGKVGVPATMNLDGTITCDRIFNAGTLNITGTCAEFGGGAESFVHVSAGTVNLTGTGSIQSASNFCGDLLMINDGTVNLSDAFTIRNNTNRIGRGVHQSSGAFIMSGGHLDNCTVSTYGGLMELNGGKITLNSSESFTHAGAYVGVDGTLEMNGVQIEVSSQKGYPVGASVDGKFVMTGGSITVEHNASNKNSSTDVVGVNICSKAGSTSNISGGTINVIVSTSSASLNAIGVNVIRSELTMSGDAAVSVKTTAGRAAGVQLTSNTDDSHDDLSYTADSTTFLMTGSAAISLENTGGRAYGVCFRDSDFMTYRTASFYMNGGTITSPDTGVGTAHSVSRYTSTFVFEDGILSAGVYGVDVFGPANGVFAIERRGTGGTFKGNGHVIHITPALADKGTITNWPSTPEIF
jgi:hypothetical protein